MNGNTSRIDLEPSWLAELGDEMQSALDEAGAGSRGGRSNMRAASAAAGRR